MRWIPWIFPTHFASPMSRLSPSITNKKRRGDKGHPCRIPFVALKNPGGEPLITTKKFVDDTHPKIEFTVSKGKPIWRRISRKKFQLTLSKALMKSSFKTRASKFFYLIVCSISWVMPIGSWFCMFFRKPSCSIEMTLERMGFSLLEMIFEISL